MTNSYRSPFVLALVVSMAGAACFAQTPGEAIYKTKCADCHGASGMADTKMARALKVKPISDPEVAKISAATMLEDARNGVAGKMPAYKGKLTDKEIIGAVDAFRSFMK
jgi:mono/diheme cytochrome c family protein